MIKFLQSSRSKRSLASIVAVLLSSLVLFFYLEHTWDRMRIDGVTGTGKTVICKTAFDIMAKNSYMIVSKTGKVVVMDPYDMIPGPRPDLITVSHMHGDHYDEEYIGKMNCRKSIAKIDTFETEGLRMVSIPASHYDDSINTSDPSDVIYVFVIDSLKIVHLGDYAQSRLSEEQIAILHGVDVLIMPAKYYPVTEQSIENILAELHPPMIFTTHTDGKRLDYLRSRTDEHIVAKEKYSLNKSDMTAGVMKLVTLERNDGMLLFARYLVYKFTGSPLLKIILAFLGMILAVWIVIKRRRRI